MVKITKDAKARARAKLLETAADHFSRQGFAGANVNNIALEAGFAKGTVYNYFASKEELFAEVLAEACHRAVERYESLEHEHTTRASLLALVLADLSVLREQEAFFKVLVREAMSFRPESYPILVEHLAPILTTLADILGRGQARGEVRVDMPAPQLALLFVGQLSLLYVQHWGSGGLWPTLEQIPELVVKMFLEGAGPAAGNRGDEGRAPSLGAGSRLRSIKEEGAG